VGKRREEVRHQQNLPAAMTKKGLDVKSQEGRGGVGMPVRATTSIPLSYNVPSRDPKKGTGKEVVVAEGRARSGTNLYGKLEKNKKKTTRKEKKRYELIPVGPKGVLKVQRGAIPARPSFQSEGDPERQREEWKAKKTQPLQQKGYNVRDGPDGWGENTVEKGNQHRYYGC